MNPKKLQKLNIMLIVVIDLMGFGIVLPLLPFFATDMHASPWTIGLIFSIYSAAQFIAAPLWGKCSDNIGRRSVMIISSLGAALSYILFAYANSLEMLFISRLLAGIMAGNIAAAQAYMADITEEKDRAKGMGLIGASIGLGFTLGPAIAIFSSHPAHANPFFIPGIIAFSMSIISVILTTCVLKDSGQKRAVQPAYRFFLFSTNFWQSLNKIAPHVKARLFGFFLLAALLLSFTQSSLYASFPLYCQAEFNITPQKVGSIYVLMGLVSIFVQGGLLRILLKYFSEKKLCAVAFAVLLMGLFLCGFAPWKYPFIAALMTMTLGAAIALPTLSSLTSQATNSEQYGAALGALQGMSGLGRVIGPAWGGVVFAIKPTYPFILTALGVSGVLCLALYASSRE
ncbi:MAG: DHA1 family tetracycline resistance protein-like MFS transporter [Candidatus Omnitrophota bacterium]|jgi:DHA1 family tetracycline resistance protein-like MFS transporter